MWIEASQIDSATTKLLQGDIGAAVGFLTFFSVLGAVVMAIIQQLKNLTAFREYWQRSQFRSWLLKRNTASLDKKPIEQVLIALATSGDAKAFYSLQIEQMTAQLSTATQFVLDYPNDASIRKTGESILLVFAPDSADDIETILHGPDLKWTMPATSLTPQDIADRQAFSDAKVRIQKHTQRSIDAIQISLGSKWTTMLQWVSTILGGAFGGGLAVRMDGLGNLTASLHVLGFAAAASILSGFLAPVTRDVVAALEALRK